VSGDRLDDNKNLPPWLHGVPLPRRPRDLSAGAAPAAPGPPAQTEPALPWPPAPSTQPQAAAEQGLPAWLREETQSPAAPPAQDPGALPDWLRDIQPATRKTGGTGPLPSWLSDMASAPAPDSDTARADAPGEAGVPDWLRESQHTADQSARSEALPSWLSDTTPTADEQPDWLRSLSAEIGIPAPAQDADATSAPVPEPTPPATSHDAGSAGVPSPYDTVEMPAWLNDSQPEQPEPFGMPPEPSATISEPAGPTTDIPDWLRETSSAAADEIDVEPFSFEGSAEKQDDELSVEPFSFEGSAEMRAAEAPHTPPDWLSGPAGVEETSEEVPQWLRSAVSQGQDLADAAPQTPDVPLWLQDFDTAGTAAPVEPVGPAPIEPVASAPAEPTPDLQAPPPTPQEPAVQDDVPPWLRDTLPTAPPAEDVPPWLRETPDAGPAWHQDDQPGQPIDDQSVPAWVRDVRPPDPQPAEQIPSWLSETQPAEPVADEPSLWSDQPPAADPLSPAIADTQLDSQLPAEPAAPAPGRYDDLPEWLRPSDQADAPPAPAKGQDLPPWLRDEGGPAPATAVPGDASLPTWLRGAPTEAAPTPQPSATQPAQPTPAGFDWFEDQADRPPETTTPAADAGLVGGIELPAWLRPPDAEPPREISPADARSLDWLTRLGAQEEEESATPVAAPTPKLSPPKMPGRTAGQVEALALLERLAAKPFPAAAPVPTVAEPAILRWLRPEQLLYIVLLLAVVLALLMPAPGWLGITTPPVAPGAADLFNQIDRLSESDIVLIGYEWDARRSGELRPIEQAVIDHLIQRKVKMVLVSTDPQGTLLLFDLRDRLAASGYRPSGQDYILLGYKPGAELALRALARNFRASLASDFQGMNATEPGTLATDLATGQPRLAQLADLSMILVLGDEPADVQGWMEQVHTSARKPDGSFVPFGFLLPAEAAPIVQPYLSQPSIYHLAGTQGALAYQQLRGGSGMPAEQIAIATQQQRLGMLVYILLFVVGAIAVGAAGVAARRRR
jgi:hypothetical protein